MITTISETIVAAGESPEIMLVLKATCALTLGLVVARVARGARASVRHLVLTATFVALVALPIAMALVPPVTVQVASAAATAAVPQTNQTSEPDLVSPKTVNHTRTSAAISAVSGSSWRLVQFAWGIGAALFFTSLVVGLWRLGRLRRAALPFKYGQNLVRQLTVTAGIRRHVEVLLSDDLAVPVTCGLKRPAILLPADTMRWSEADLRRAFVHELEHIKRFDWPIHILTGAICAIYWFHPLAWIASRQLCLEAERTCDDAVLLQAARDDYAEQLVGLARRLSQALATPALSMANRSDLSRRVSAILDSNQSRGRTSLGSVTAALVTAVVLVLAIAPVRAGSSTGRRQQAPEKRPDTRRPVEKALNGALLEACESGNLDDVTKLLDAGAQVNATVDGDGSPLIVAARAGELKTVLLLLERGADINLGVRGDGNPLIMAAREGHENIVKLLLDRGANIEQVVPGDENALIQASGAGQLAVVKLLVSRGADVNARVWSSETETRGEWRTPLSVARKGRQEAVVNFLLSSGARE
jgi:beta-lactamase regulating signal transducer with metallopeptidase domain